MTVRLRHTVMGIALAAALAWPTAGQAIETAKAVASTDRAHLMAQRFAAGDAASADRPSIDYEMEMLRRARAEAQEQQGGSKPDIKPDSRSKITPKSAAATPVVAKPDAAAKVEKPILKTDDTRAPSTPANQPARQPESRPGSRAVITVAPFAKPPSETTPVDTATPRPPAPLAAKQPPVAVTVHVLPPAEKVETRSPYDVVASPAARPLERRQIPQASLTRDGRWVLERRAPHVEVAAQPPAPATSMATATATQSTHEIADTPIPAARRATRGRDADVRPTIADASRTRHRGSVLVVLTPELSDMVLVDPVLCFGSSCFVSAGLTDAATPHARDALFALETTRGLTADSCRQKSACAFRDVSWADGDQFEIIDLASADKKRLGTAVTSVPDASCRATAGSLACANPVATADFDAWVVPEKTATDAGPAAIEDVIADGLPPPQLAHAGATDK